MPRYLDPNNAEYPSAEAILSEDGEVILTQDHEAFIGPHTRPRRGKLKKVNSATDGVVNYATGVVLDTTKSIVYALLANLWNIFAGGTGWAMLSLLNEEHEELDPFLRDPVSTTASTSPFLYSMVNCRKSSFNVLAGLDEVQAVSSVFDVVEDTFIAMTTNRTVVNWVE